MHSKANDFYRVAPNILITGASGFLGSCLSNTAKSRGYSVTSVFRDFRFDHLHLSGNGQNIVVPDIDGSTIWSAALQDRPVKPGFVVLCSSAQSR